MRKITIDPGYPHRGPRADHHPPGRRRQRGAHPVPRHPGARLRKIHRGPAVLRDARHHRAHLRHLPDQPPAGFGQGVRRHHGGAHSARRRRCCARPSIAASSCNRTPSASSTCPRPTCCWAWIPTRRSATCSGWREKHPEIVRDGIALRKFGQRVIERLAGERIHPPGIVPGGVAAPLERPRATPFCRRLPEARGHRLAHAGPFQVHPGRLSRGDRELRQDAHHVRGPGGAGGRTAALRRPHALPGRRTASMAADIDPRAITPATSARRRWRIPI